MPFLIPVLVGISVLFGGRYVIYIWCIKPRKTRNRDIGIAISESR